MSGFYEPKHDLHHLSMDELQRIGAALFLLWEVDHHNGNESEANRTVKLMEKIGDQHEGSVGHLPECWAERKG